MTLSEKSLLKSGFSQADIQKIKSNMARYGGTLEEVVQDLRNRFRAFLWIASACSCVFIFLLLFASQPKLVGGGISLLITALIVAFIQPPVLAFKAWRYWQLNRHSIPE